jgi:hypothetical protein
MRYARAGGRKARALGVEVVAAPVVIEERRAV